MQFGLFIFYTSASSACAAAKPCIHVVYRVRCKNVIQDVLDNGHDRSKEGKDDQLKNENMTLRSNMCHSKQ